MHFNVSGNFCPHTSSSKSSAPPATTDGFKSPRPQSIVLRQPPTKPGSRGPREQLTPTTLRFAYEAFLGLSQDRAAKAAHAQRKRLPTVASQDCKRESQPTPAGVLRSPRKKKKGVGVGGKQANTGPFSFSFFHFYFKVLASAGGSPGPAGSAPGGRWSGACTCHFAREQEPHPPDTCQAAAQTPPGCPRHRPRARDPVTAPPPPRGDGGRGEPRGSRGPRAGAAPSVSPAPPRCARRPRARAPFPPSLRPSRGGRAPHLARGSSSGPLSCSGSSSRGGGGGGGGGSAAAALRGALGGMTRCAGPARANEPGERGSERGARGGGRARTPGTPRPQPTPVTKIMGTSPLWKTGRARQPSAGANRGKTSLPPAASRPRGSRAAGVRGNRGGGGGGGGGSRRGRGREAAEKPRLPGPVSARLVPVGGASTGGAGRSAKPWPLGERWTGRAPRQARAAGKTKTNVPRQSEVGSAAGWAVQGGAITGLREMSGLRTGEDGHCAGS